MNTGPSMSTLDASSHLKKGMDPPSSITNKENSTSSGVRSSKPDLFSPTSAAALALSTLQHCGAGAKGRKVSDAASTRKKLFASSGSKTQKPSNIPAPQQPVDQPMVPMTMMAPPPHFYHPYAHYHGAVPSIPGWMPVMQKSGVPVGLGAPPVSESAALAAKKRGCLPGSSMVTPTPKKLKLEDSIPDSALPEWHKPGSSSQRPGAGSKSVSRPYIPDGSLPEWHKPMNAAQGANPSGRTAKKEGPTPTDVPSAFLPQDPPVGISPNTLLKPYTELTRRPEPAQPQPLPGSDEQATYSRKKKSLALLAENFIDYYRHSPRGTMVIVDMAASHLGVERRRIYDVVNILEAICLVTKKQKNTYAWLGMESLDVIFGRIQAHAVEEYPDDAKQFGFAPRSDDDEEAAKARARRLAVPRDHKSLARLSQDFLKLFLAGVESISLPDASTKIHGYTPEEEIAQLNCHRQYVVGEELSEGDMKAAINRNYKTKIRRLYDIANVFLSVGLLKKDENGRRPTFSWAYKLSAKDIYEQHQKTLNGYSETPSQEKEPEPSQVESGSQSMHPRSVSLEPEGSSAEMIKSAAI